MISCEQIILHFILAFAFVNWLRRHPEFGSVVRKLSDDFDLLFNQVNEI